MELARAYSLLARFAPKGYDPQAKSFRPWWRFGRYDVQVRQGEGVSHMLGSRIVVAARQDACPHVVVHGFIHEAGHVQMLFLDIGVATATIPAALEVSWLACAGAVLAWQFVWREITAEVYAVSKLGLRCAVRGYSHLGRTTGRARRTVADSGP